MKTNNNNNNMQIVSRNDEPLLKKKVGMLFLWNLQPKRMLLNQKGSKFAILTFLSF